MRQPDLQEVHHGGKPRPASVVEQARALLWRKAQMSQPDLQEVHHGGKPRPASVVEQPMWQNGTHPSWEISPSVKTSRPSSNSSAPLQCVAEAEFQHLLLPITYSTVCVLSLASNGVALWSCWASRARAPPVMIFIYNLIAIDLLFALSLPLQAVYHVRNNDWPFGENLCKATNALFLANMFSCTLFLACICLERYLAVIHPVRYLRLRWPLCRVLLSLAIWTVIGIGLLTIFSRSSVTSQFPNGNTACMENFPAHVWSGCLAGMVLASSALGFFVPFLTIVICSVVIAQRIVHLSHGSAQASSLRRHSLCTLLMVTTLLTLCFLPFHVIYTLHTLGRIGVLSSPGLLQFTCSAQRATMALASINSALDPLVYYFNMEPAHWKLSCCRTILQHLKCSHGASPTEEVHQKHDLEGEILPKARFQSNI
ncbi:uracil nucleotide/cysteinyl leukotriene receptor-like [Eublepharis macularius]|uniref:Uracil nucleotide/cysteinyl leukotriene receptor-like n=1 Tax=Eublepharis macularius TaxID=481883 RepID=A0AA97J7J1_EUBMA|nr:uracil nucleotide/cysteinyl leukotriene receptor-like [Eublepharis macularius]